MTKQIKQVAMDRKKIVSMVDRLRSDVNFEIETHGELDAISFENEEGVLLSVNEATFVIDTLQSMIGEKPVRERREILRNAIENYNSGVNNISKFKLDEEEYNLFEEIMEEYASLPRPFKMPVLVDEEGKEHEALSIQVGSKDGVYCVMVRDGDVFKAFETNENCKLIQK